MLENKRTKFCILSSQRSGSTWLRELLNIDQHIVSFPELFISQKPHHNWSDDHLMLFCNYKKKYTRIRPFSVFDYISQLDKYPGDYSAIGFKLMYDQFLLHPEIILKLVSDQFKVIHLVRQNYLDVMISVTNMKEKRIVQARSNIEIDKIRLNPDKLLFNIYKHDTLVRSFENLLKIIPNQVLKITYETLCNNLDETLLSIADFLNLNIEPSSFYTDLQKINLGSLKDKILNYDEVEKVLIGSRFEYLLESRNIF